MTKKIVSWLSFMTVFLLTLQSCVHDEIYSSSDPVSKDYHSKSLWKEDEVYIKNVQRIFLANANIDNFENRHHGLPVWDYAMTFGHFDESYLMVPISNKNGIKEVMIVERKEDKIFFSISTNVNASRFFKNLIFKNDSVPKPQTQIEENEKIVCKTRTYTLCFGNPNGSQDCYPSEVTTCVQQQELGENEIGGGSSGIDYESGSGGSNNSNDTPQNQNPCEKTKSVLNKPNVQAGINNVKAQAVTTISNVYAGETGFKEKKDGTIAPADITASHKVVYNNVTDSKGGYHNHTANGTHMFSPPDITDTLLGFAAAQNNVSDAYFGMIAAEWCSTCSNHAQFKHYVIQYTGAAADLGTGGNYNFTPAQVKQFEKDYRKIIKELTDTSLNGNTYVKNSAGDLNEKGLEKLFFETLNIIGMSGKVILQRIEPNGTIYNVTLDSSNMPVGLPCPN